MSGLVMQREIKEDKKMNESTNLTAEEYAKILDEIEVYTFEDGEQVRLKYRTAVLYRRPVNHDKNKIKPFTVLRSDIEDLAKESTRIMFKS